MNKPRIVTSFALGIVLVVATNAAAQTSPPGGYALRPETTSTGSPTEFDRNSPKRSTSVEAPPAPTAFRTSPRASRVSQRPNADSSVEPSFAGETIGEDGGTRTAPNARVVPDDAVLGGADLNLGPENFLRGRPVGTYVDLDVQRPERGDVWFESDSWDWQFLPTSLLYKSYLAGVKESRFATLHTYNKNDGWLWEPVLGARVGILRYGNHDLIHPEGWQWDIEGSAQARLYVPSNVDVRSVDFRAGTLLTHASGPWRTKFGYYHLSSHLGDEFLLANPDYPRLNYVRDALVAGEAYYVTDNVRVYFDVAWAFNCEYAKPWEFQFGLDYAPALPTGLHGAPFFAVNGYVRQELNYGGNFVVQTGWAWRGDEAGRLLRIGVQYINGKSQQFSFYDQSDQALGIGIWYDF